MKLVYSTGKNFGDSLNPIILNHFFKNFFDEDTDTIFIGIGSILGLFEKFGFTNAKKKIVFSSGFALGHPKAYGEAPIIDKSYDVRCVRGPLTANIMALPKDKAIADGAILLKEAIGVPKHEKKYSFSFIPHKNTLEIFTPSNWKKILDDVSINLINPLDNYQVVLDSILSSEIVIAEAMHGAIIADLYRVPWIPLKTHIGINEFKWLDYAASMELDVNFEKTKTLYSTDFIKKIIDFKLSHFRVSSTVLTNTLSRAYKLYQIHYLEKVVRSQLIQVKKQKPYLSSDNILSNNVDRLIECINGIKCDYKNKKYV